MTDQTCRHCGFTPPEGPAAEECPICAAHAAVRDGSPVRGGDGAPRDKGGGIAEALALARSQLDMDLAFLGEITAGREVVVETDGDGAWFGLAEGDSVDLAETYCRHVIEGRSSGIIPHAASDELVGSLPITRSAGIGAYVGVPVTAPDARLYMLCCRPTSRGRASERMTSASCGACARPCSPRSSGAPADGSPRAPVGAARIASRHADQRAQPERPPQAGRHARPEGPRGQRVPRPGSRAVRDRPGAQHRDALAHR